MADRSHIIVATAKIELESLLSQEKKNNESNDEKNSMETGTRGDAKPLGKKQAGVFRFSSEGCRFRPVIVVVTTLLLLVGIPFFMTTRSVNLWRVSSLTDHPDFQFNVQQQKKNEQIDNFRLGRGLMLNIHITHHAGTTLCAVLGRALGAPRGFCMYPKLDDETGIDEDMVKAFPRERPWSDSNTSANLNIVLDQGYRFLSWEFGKIPVRSPILNETRWEDPQLVSVLVIRDPISRALAGDGFTMDHYPFVRKFSHNPPGVPPTTNSTMYDETIHGTLEQWWQFANDPHYDNFALRRLVGHSKDAVMTRIHLEAAQQLVSRFTFVLDQTCLEDNLEALQNILNMTPTTRARRTYDKSARRQQDDSETTTTRKGSGSDDYHNHVTLEDKDDRRSLMANPHDLPNAERIPFPEVYEYLLDKFRYDIELYEWAKRKSLVPCFDSGET